MQIARKFQSSSTAILVGALVSLTALAPSGALAATDIGTLTKGSTVQSCGGGIQVLSGYISSLTGSYSPTGLTGGNAVSAVYDGTAVQCLPLTTYSVLTVSGFSSNPGSSWLTSITCNGVTRAAASAGFSYSSGNAYWFWTYQQFGFSSLSNGTNVGCTIVHN